MDRKFPSITLLTCILLTFNEIQAQDILYSNEFSLKDVVLLDGPFKHARDLNIETILKYDVDRLIAPFRKEAGLSEKAPLFPNWQGLDGHIGGHYLTALAMNYAATGNTECKKRMDYIIAELKICQDANEMNNPEWGKGYLGGIPNSKGLWGNLMKGDFRIYRSTWAPWYNLHKMFAGLRDAWIYTGNVEAKVMFLNYCDWGIFITSALSDEQMQTMLDSEHGGINESFADAYQISGDTKYLTAAKRFSHKMLLDAMAAGNDNLDNKHANTQIPKAIGFQRIAELTPDQKYSKAGSYFWETVTGNRSLAFGGNSRREFFPAVASCIDFVNDIEGPESCNSYNMLKLTEDLFRTDPSGKFVDYYERTLYNHILSTQHPEHGGYVYFTPARPRHYRVYSAPNAAMWCCVGTGMENHGKYNQFIYTHIRDSLFLNLFIPSELNWREKGIVIRQETSFPDEEKTKLTIIKGASKFSLMIRHPSWVKQGALKITVNGKPVSYKTNPSSYISVNRNWKAGDVVDVLLPMHNTIEQLPYVSQYIAIMHGPVLLGAKTGTDDLKGLVADDSRWGQIPGGQKLPVDKAPIIIEDDRSKIVNSLVPVKDKPLTFTAPAINMINVNKVEFEPFFRIHDSRYMMYWMTLSKAEYSSYLDSLGKLENEKIELQKRTIDFVAPGEQQPESDHGMENSNSNTGSFNDEFWRDARNEGYFIYNMRTNSEAGLSLIIRYWGADRGNRKFDIYIDDDKLVSVDNTGRWNQTRFMDVEYQIPDSMTRGKKDIRVKFQALPGASTSQVYYVRLARKAGAGNNLNQSLSERPCDIYAAAGNPCVAAHSSTRALYASYSGPLYQVMRQSDGKTLDICVVQPSEGDPGGYADAAAQDAFCTNTLCWIAVVYDQSGNANHLVQAPPGTFRGPAKGGFNTLPIADMAPITIMGHKAYGVYIIPGMGLRNNNAKGLAINDEPQSIYMVCDGTHFDSGCCFNYGNTSTNSRAVGRGTMETVYFGTATAWGRGSGPGPWIMSDMEAGLFSGYDAKQNIADPTIDAWRFVTGVVNGGGGNQWEIRGGNAQKEGLKTFYSGLRPASRENNYYYPMHRKGSVQLGNGGDNGNGSAGTFYEGVMTSGYPTDATHNAVQANIAAARYDVQRVSLSRITTFTPESSQEVTETFTNSTGAPATGVMLTVSVPAGWTALVKGSGNSSKTFENPVAPGTSVSATFTVGSPAKTGTDFFTGKAEWKIQASGLIQSETTSQRVRNVYPVKINEVRFEVGGSPTDQFIELFNSGSSEIDLSGWTLISTHSMWAPVKLATIPAGTKLAAHGFYLLGLSPSGLAAPANRGENIINVRSTTGFEAGHQIDIDGEIRTIANIGTAATPMTPLFVPVSTRPWLTIPAGSTNLPVTLATGFEVGQKIGIDLGGNYEVATVTAVGKGATQTILSQAANTGDTIIKVAACANITIGDMLTLNTGSRKELVRVKRILNVIAAPSPRPEQPGYSTSSPGDVVLTAPLRSDHMLSVDVSDPGTGISFSPATRFVHKGGDAVQALGSGITLKSTLEKNHEVGAAVLNPMVTSVGYQGSVKPNQYYGAPISTSAGSVALMDASGVVVVDAMIYGSQQSNSSANGIITTPEIAILEGNQDQGGCMVIAPGSTSGSGPFTTVASKENRSAGRFPDGNDTDSNCNDFLMQSTSTLAYTSSAGTNNIKVTSIAGFGTGQKITIGTGSNSETAVVSKIGTAGGTTTGTATSAGMTAIIVAGVQGFSTGQTITIDGDANPESAMVASIAAARRRFGGAGNTVPLDTIKLTVPLKFAHAAGTQISGSGITLTAPLTQAHEKGVQISGHLPTPGQPNQYIRKP